MSVLIELSTLKGELTVFPFQRPQFVDAFWSDFGGFWVRRSDS